MNLSSSAWNQPRVFTESSLWIRTYRRCQSYMAHFDVGLPEPTDLCTLVRGYGWGFLCFILPIAFAVTVMGWLVYMIVRGLTDAVHQFAGYRDIGYGFWQALLSTTPVACTIFIIVVMAICALGLAYGTYAQYLRDSRNRLVHNIGWAMHKFGLIVLIVLFAPLAIALVVLFGPFVLAGWLLFRIGGWIYRALRNLPRKPRTSPTVWSVLWQYVYGRLHGICFPITVKADA